MAANYTKRPNWSEKHPEAWAKIQLLARRGLYHQEIAAAINHEFGFALTRNSVIGICHRGDVSNGKRPNGFKLGVKKKEKRKPDSYGGVAAQHQIARIEAKARLGAMAKTLKRPMAERVAAALIKAEPIKQVVYEGGPNKCLLTDLKFNSCRWPLGGFLDEPPFFYCGEKALNDKPYCLEHHVLGSGRTNRD